MGVALKWMCSAWCVLSAEACTELRDWSPYPPPGELEQTMPLPGCAPAGAMFCFCGGQCLLHHHLVVCERGLLGSPEGSLHPRSIFAKTAVVAHKPVDGCCTGISMQAKGTMGCPVSGPI